MVDRKAQISATILSNQVVAAYTNRMQISAPAWAAHTHAGHFVNVLLPQAGELLWRRPYSVHGANRALGTIELLFNTTGRGSRALSLLTAGCSLELLGLLGNTFTFPENMQQVVIVAGGLGIAPFRLLLQDLADRPIRKNGFFMELLPLHGCAVYPNYLNWAPRCIFPLMTAPLGTRGLWLPTWKNTSAWQPIPAACCMFADPHR